MKLYVNMAEDMRLEDIPEPEPGATEVKIKVKWCRYLRSDVHEYRVTWTFAAKKAHPGTGKMAPITVDMNSLAK